MGDLSGHPVSVLPVSGPLGEGDREEAQRKACKARGVPLTVSDTENVQGIKGPLWDLWVGPAVFKGIDTSRWTEPSVLGISKRSCWIGRELV